MSAWGREFLWPDETASEWCWGWLSREAIPDKEEAIALAARELSESPETIQATPVLCREESQVEAKINGHEMPLWVECTKRAQHPEPFWRFEEKQVREGEGASR